MPGLPLVLSRMPFMPLAPLSAQQPAAAQEARVTR
jgi:hypothetical protein